MSIKSYSAAALALYLAGLAGTASAAVIAEGIGAESGVGGFQLPVVGLLMSQPTLRTQVIAQIQGLNAAPNASISLTPALNAAPALSAAPAAMTPAAIATPASIELPASLAPAVAAPALSESQEIVRGLLNHPEVLAAHSAELSRALGADNVALAAAAAKSEKLKASLGTGLEIDPTDAGAVARVAEKLSRAFDGNSAANTEAGVVPAAYAGAQSRGADLPASWRLTPNQKIHPSEPGAEAEAMKMLASALKIMDLPSAKERFVDNPVDEPAVVWAGLPSIWKLAIFREGGRQDPGNVLYSLDSSWFIQVPDANGRNQLYATKGLYFEKDGSTPVIVTYKHPRRVRYFGNWLTLGAFDTASGVPLEKNLDAPMSSSSRLENVTNDKLWTRLLLAGEGARVPATRAFLMPDHVFMKRQSRMPNSKLVKAGGLPKSRDAIRAAVVEFLSRFNGPEVVVKPSGARFHSGEGVGFFKRDDVEGITDHVIMLSKTPHMDNVGAILLEQRLAPPPIYFRTGDYAGQDSFVYRDKKKYSVSVLTPEEVATAAPHERKDYNERVYVVRDRNGESHTVPMTFFRAGTWGMPTSSQPKDPRDAAAVVDFDVMRRAWAEQYGGLMSTDEEVAEFLHERADIGERALRAIIANEKYLRRQKGEPYQAQTDMIGMDVMYQLENGKLVPYIIEVNDHDAAGQHAIDLFHPDQVGAHSTEWIEGMRERARQDAVANP